MTEASVDSPNTASKIKGLYLLLDQRWASRWALADILRHGADLGVRVVQYRNKHDAMNEVYRQALELRKIARDSGVTFIVNDRCDVGVAVEADGVHLGQSDLPIRLARELLGAKCLIGMSTHSLEQVVEATEQGADYLGFGPLFPTNTKANHEPVVGLDGMKKVRSLTSLPIVAIGGIQSESVSKIVAAGADAVAVASGILDSTNPRQAIKRYMESFP
ncbi:MAG: thiamine phosphate synthase [Nitrospirota bacterium]|nr:MAG: thiamine phosphate synthase [Nitrospirota bacterium]